MRLGARLRALGRRLGRYRQLPTWYDPAYRLPMPALEGEVGIEPRRADLVAWFLVEQGVIGSEDLRTPHRASYEELALVHTPEYLESLSRPDTLARIFAVDPSQVPVDEALRTVRLAVGGTIDAARESLRRDGPTLNLLGGFHHAAPEHGGGMCPLNDIAVAVAVLRQGGLGGQVVVLDLDAHPPDGTAACVARDREVWIGSLSGSDWGPPPGALEVLVTDYDDARYLTALGGLIRRMPRPRLAFVIAGGDVLAGDRLGRIGLSLAGARERDLRVARALDGVPSVWLPGGGYSDRAWRVLAGTALALGHRSRRPVPVRDPLASRFAAIARGLHTDQLHDQGELSQGDIDASLEVSAPSRPRLLGYYPAEGIEYALFRYGILGFLHRLGYSDFRVELGAASSGGDRVQLLGRAGGRQHLLVEAVLERMNLDALQVLYVHWLSLRNPRARFPGERPALPGQVVPGLGLAREVVELLARIAERLHLDGVAFRPSWYHTAYVARHQGRFVDPARQGRFEALVRDLAGRPLLEATTLVAEKRVLLDGKPYEWEADLMLDRLGSSDEPDPRIALERERVCFTVQS
jgi:acetoin utilization deacetylase AcuC-like enzyme